MHRSPPPIVVYVAGDVRNPGIYRLSPQARAADALARAGGAKPDADLVAVNLAAPLHDGEEIAVQKIGAVAPRARRSPTAHPRAQRTSHARTARRPPADVSIEIVDLNSADEIELQTLPGIGPALAARIVAYREINGAFASVDELADVSGVTPHLLDAIVPYATVR
ncbi:MAG: ComEA family DNA-binding protein [Candidatus Velthaea sp.]